MSNWNSILALLFALSLVSNATLAQEQLRTKEGEIWMTEAELEAFLTHIAKRKKQQIQKRQQTRRGNLQNHATMHSMRSQDPAILLELQRINERIDYLYNRQATDQPQANRAVSSSLQTEDKLATYSNSGNRQYIDEAETAALRQYIDDLHTEINLLRAQVERSGTSRYDSDRQREISSLQRSLDRLYQRLHTQESENAIARQLLIESARNAQSPRTVVVPPVVVPENNAPNRYQPQHIGLQPSNGQMQATDSTLINQLHAATLLNVQLQEQIDQLYKKIEKDSDSTEIVQQQGIIAELETLSERVRELSAADSAALAQNNSIAESQLVLENYHHTIYFANNSTTITDADVSVLHRLFEKVSSAQQKVTVILRGYSSAVGNAQYNEQLSRRRAEAVKQTLVQLGMEPKHVVTLHHGADASKNDRLARRVEVTLSL